MPPHITADIGQVASGLDAELSSFRASSKAAIALIEALNDCRLRLSEVELKIANAINGYSGPIANLANRPEVRNIDAEHRRLEDLMHALEASIFHLPCRMSIGTQS